MTKLLNETKVLLTDVRLSYANIFEPTSFDGNEPKYSAAILIDKEDTETLDILKQALTNAKEDYSEKHGKAPASLRVPLRDGDEERPDDVNYQGMYFFNASSKRAPEVVGKYLDPETNKPVVLDEEDVYSGCFVNVSINFYPYNVSGNKGIAAGLGNIQKSRDGERLSGGASAEAEFEFEAAPEVEEDDWLS